MIGPLLLFEMRVSREYPRVHISQYNCDLRHSQPHLKDRADRPATSVVEPKALRGGLGNIDLLALTHILSNLELNRCETELAQPPQARQSALKRTLFWVAS